MARDTWQARHLIIPNEPLDHVTAESGKTATSDHVVCRILLCSWRTVALRHIPFPIWRLLLYHQTSETKKPPLEVITTTSAASADKTLQLLLVYSSEFRSIVVYYVFVAFAMSRLLSSLFCTVAMNFAVWPFDLPAWTRLRSNEQSRELFKSFSSKVNVLTQKHRHRIDFSIRSSTKMAGNKLQQTTHGQVSFLCYLCVSCLQA